MNVFNNLREILKAQGIVERERTLLELVIYALFLHNINLSLRNVSKALEMIESYRSHVSVWKWVQRYGKELGKQVFVSKISDVLIVDETEVKIGNGQWYFMGCHLP